MKHQQNIYRSLLGRLYSRHVDVGDLKSLKSWLEDEHHEFDELCQEVWDTVPTTASDHREEPMLESILEQISVEPRKNYSLLFLKIVASVLFLLSMVLGYDCFKNYSHAKQLAMQSSEVVVDYGQRAHLTLPDGSRVWLNSGSQLNYGADFNQKNRTVELLGEAKFEVAKNPEKHFIVKCSGIQVEALGTVFAVKGYQIDSTVTASLLEGKVRVYNHTSGITLMPMQQIIYNRNQGTFTMREMEDSCEADFWLKGFLYFHDTSLAEMALTLERLYGVNVVFSTNELRKATFTGTIRNNSLQNVLHIISLTYPLRYEIKNNTVVLSNNL
uniref:DUF4974 domain-containing protein n=1 Tax=Prevotella sp. GTC17253 TaxID=3236793 RepID=A0AB33IT08_9BACT